MEELEAKKRAAAQEKKKYEFNLEVWNVFKVFVCLHKYAISKLRDEILRISTILLHMLFQQACCYKIF